MRPRPSVVLAVLLATAFVGGWTWWARYHYDPTAGPIDSSQNGLAYAQPLEVGQAMSAGITALYNSGKKPVVVEGVRLLGVTGPLELLGVRTRLFPQQGAGTFAAEFGFPPERWITKPLAEQDVLPVPKEFNESGDPTEGLQLAIGVRATKPGIAAYRAVEVHYRVGGRKYREVFEYNTVHLCTPFSEYVSAEDQRLDKRCPPREREDVFEDRVLEWPPPAGKDAAGS